MSNALAFATATFVLQRQLQRAVSADVDGAVATTFRPDGTDGALPACGVNIYMLQANTSGELGAPDLPARSANRAVINRPQAVLELVYFLTFHGAEATLQPQRVQASVLRYLHSQPCLTKAMIRDAIDAALKVDGNHFLKTSNLADQAVTLKLTPWKVTLEDLSKIWSVFFQTHYALSSTFCARFVLLDTEDAARESLPVRFPRAFAMPFSETRIDGVSPERLAYAPAAEFAIAGRALLGPDKRYLIGDLPAALLPGSSAVRVKVALPAGVRAGLQQVKVLDQAPLGAGHAGTESNSVGFLLLPAVQSITHQVDPSAKKEHTISVKVLPSLVVGLDQRAVLILNRLTPPAAGKPWSYSLSANIRAVETADLVFRAKEVLAGTYIYRLRVDGADSELTIDETQTDPLQQPYSGPTIAIP